MDFIKDAYEYVLPYFNVALPLLFAALLVIFFITRFDTISTSGRFKASLVTILIAAGIFAFTQWKTNDNSKEQEAAFEIVDEALNNLASTEIKHNSEKDEVEIYYKKNDNEEVTIVTDQGFKTFKAKYKGKTYEFKIVANEDTGGIKIVHE